MTETRLVIPMLLAACTSGAPVGVPPAVDGGAQEGREAEDDTATTAGTGVADADSVSDASVDAGTTDADTSEESDAAPPDATAADESQDGEAGATDELECFPFLAHAANDPARALSVGAGKDLYFSVSFAPPWQGTVYGVVVRPVIDNAEVLTRAVLYRVLEGTEGEVETGMVLAPDELVHSWGPGGTPLDLRPHAGPSGDVALELDDAAMYVLELRYDSENPDAEDASGIEVCVQRTPPVHLAAVSRLGYENGITDLTLAIDPPPWDRAGECYAPADRWTGRCEPRTTNAIHILSVTPHMRAAGLRMSAQIERREGDETRVRTLHDGPFDVRRQVSYAKDEVLAPGETIVTTCEFSEPKCAGTVGTGEACYLYVVHWPRGRLADGGQVGAFLHGQNACLGY